MNLLRFDWQNASRVALKASNNLVLTDTDDWQLSFDHSICPVQYRLRNCEADLLGGFQINN